MQCERIGPSSRIHTQSLSFFVCIENTMVHRTFHAKTQVNYESACTVIFGVGPSSRMEALRLHLLMNETNRPATVPMSQNKKVCVGICLR